MSRTRRILVCEVNHLGDFVATLPLLAALRRSWPEAELGLYTSPPGAALAQGLEELSQVHAVDYARHRGRWLNPRALASEALAVRRCGYDAVLAAHDECTTSALLARMAGVPLRIGFRGAARGSAWWEPALEFNFERHVAENHLRLLAALAERWGERAEPGRFAFASLRFERDEEARYRARFADLADAKPVLIHPFAKFPHKEWGEQRFRQLVARLATTAGGHPVTIVTGGCAFSDVPGTIRIDRTEVRELAWLVSRAAVVVGNNSGPVNLAAAFGVPSVCVGGPSPRWWRPDRLPGARSIYLQGRVWCAPCERPGLPRRCLRSLAEPECMAAVSVEEVQDAVLETLEVPGGVAAPQISPG